MIVLDASVLIGYLDANDAHHQRARTLLADSVDDDLTGSPLTIAEVLVQPARTGRLPLVQSILDALEVTVTPFPADAPTRLAFLRTETGLKMPDCCVVLTAEAVGATIATFDDRLTAAAARRHLPTLGSA